MLLYEVLFNSQLSTVDSGQPGRLPSDVGTTVTMHTQTIPSKYLTLLGSLGLLVFIRQQTSFGNSGIKSVVDSGEHFTEKAL